MDWRAEIRDALRGMVREMLIDGALQATVKSVDKQAGTIVATGLKEDIDYHDVRLKAVVADGNGRGIIAYPVVGSQVNIVVLDGIDTMMFVSQVSDIESYLVKADNGVSIELTAGGKLLLNGDGCGGLVKVQELKAQLAKTNAVLSAIKGVLTATPGWVPTQADGIALKAAMNTALAGKTVGDFTQLENPNVKHG
jgi:hypothetical protein